MFLFILPLFRCLGGSAEIYVCLYLQYGGQYHFEFVKNGVGLSSFKNVSNVTLICVQNFDLLAQKVLEIWCTKNQDNPIKTVGRDSFLSPKTPKNTSF